MKKPQPDDDMLQKLVHVEQESKELAVELAATKESLDQERAETQRGARFAAGEVSKLGRN